MLTVFRGGDGSVFHPDILKNETLHVFNKDACQSIPIVFEKEIDSNGIPGYRYVTLIPQLRFILMQFYTYHSWQLVLCLLIYLFHCRFTPPDNVFDKPSTNPSNKCFYAKNEPYTTPKGLFNVSKCQHDTPLFLSWPHFYKVFNQTVS